MGEGTLTGQAASHAFLVQASELKENSARLVFRRLPHCPTCCVPLFTHHPTHHYFIWSPVEPPVNTLAHLLHLCFGLITDHY